MPISVYLDKRVGFSVRSTAGLAVELPKSEFCLCLTREAKSGRCPRPRGLLWKQLSLSAGFQPMCSSVLPI
jgi:hypothetical protein